LTNYVVLSIINMKIVSFLSKPIKANLLKGKDAKPRV